MYSKFIIDTKKTGSQFVLVRFIVSFFSQKHPFPKQNTILLAYITQSNSKYSVIQRLEPCVSNLSVLADVCLESVSLKVNLSAFVYLKST